MSVPVPIPCPCPGTPHEGDTVELREKLGLAAGIALQRLIVQANQDRQDAAELTGVLAEAYLLHGVESWTLVDEGGLPVPVSATTIREWLLSDFTLGSPVADAADGIYMAQVILPLVKAAENSLRSSLTSASTSVPPAGTRKGRKPPKRSLTSTSQMDGIEPTLPSPAGASS